MFPYAKTKTPEQMRSEARAAAAQDLREILSVIDDAGAANHLKNASGAAGLIGCAHALYAAHLQRIEIESTDFGPDTVGDLLLPVPRSLGRPFVRRASRSEPTDAPTEPEQPADPEAFVCIQCGSPVRDHAEDGTCPVAPSAG